MIENNAWGYVYASIVIAVIAITSNEALAGDLRVISIWPEPNYNLDKNDGSLDVLHDGAVNDYPMWIKSDVIGWRRVELVRIEVDIGERTKQKIKRGIKFHLPCNLDADVAFPKKINIFEKTGDDASMVASISYPEKCKKGHHWKRVFFKSASDKILIVVHTRNSWFSLDEIASATTKEASRSDALKGGGELNAKLSPPGEGVKHAQDLVSLNHIKYPYGNLSVEQPVSESDYSIVGLKGTEEVIAFSLYNRRKRKVSFRIFPKGEDLQAKIFNVTFVKTASEKVVLDALEEARDGVLEVPGQGKAVFWVNISLEGTGNVSNKGAIVIESKEAGFKRSISLRVRSIDCGLEENKKPYVINWAYLHQKPICRGFEERCVQDSMEHYANVFVIPPGRLPGLLNPGDKARKKLLQSYLSYLRESKLVLLYLDLNNTEYEELRRNLINGESSSRYAVQKWVSSTRDIMENSGFSVNEWAIYAIDEPHAKDIPLLNRFFEIVKSSYPSVQIYENPAYIDRRKIKARTVNSFFEHVDFLQPLMKEWYSNKNMYNGYKGSLWLYDIPSVPAKERHPYGWYRNLPVRAWLEGARGIGFWSYNGTTKTSAWNDVDGNMPDFSVVYESESGPVGSRRWEAFREGIEDYILYSVYAEKIADQKHTGRLKREVANSLFDSDAASLLRIQLLKDIANTSCGSAK